MKRISLIMAFMIIILLSSCSNPLTFILPREYYISAEPAYLEYTAELKDGGVVFTSKDVVLSARAAAGSIGAVLTGYNMTFYFSDGNPVYPGDSSVGSGVAAARVPPGLVCPTSTDSTPSNARGANDRQTAPTSECTINTKGVTRAVGPLVPFTTLPGIAGQLEYVLFCDKRPDNGAFARVTVYGRDDVGENFQFDYDIPLRATGSFIPPNFPNPGVCQ